MELRYAHELIFEELPHTSPQVGFKDGGMVAIYMAISYSPSIIYA
jgi:hypothetical protein